MYSNERHPCDRHCVKGAQPLVCKYTFAVQWYQTLSKACYNCPYNVTDCRRQHCVPADGFKRSVLAVNKQIPGPAVIVRKTKQNIFIPSSKVWNDTTTFKFRTQIKSLKLQLSSTQLRKYLTHCFCCFDNTW